MTWLFSDPLPTLPLGGGCPSFPRGGRGYLPDDVALEKAILVALGRRLPLDHDGLIGPAAGDDILWGGCGGLLREGDPGYENIKRGWAFPLLVLRANTGV